jgi:hypothetical protein
MAQIENGKAYKWASPGEWLEDRLNRYAESDDMNAIHHIAQELLTKLDSDQIQDLFQDEMDAEGYFKPIRKRGAR